MQDSNNENTIPTRPNRGTEETVPTRPINEPVAPAPEYQAPVEPTRPTPAKPAKVHGPRRWPWVILGILLVVLLAGLGGWMGYNSALQLRKAKFEESRVTTATEHFMLGIQAQNNKQYIIAQQQFEYVIRIDPNFPGAQDKLREVLIAMAVRETPTPAPTTALPTLTPTKDTRPQEQIFAQAKQQYANKDWDGLFATIDSLRQIDPKYHAVEIDDMLYVALRYRGIDKILQKANLEGGLYDLALAERFGPLDVDAQGYRNWSRAYLNGASFWEIDWLKVIEAFEQIYPYVPQLRDSSGMTAIERYRIAARSYADQLVSKGDNCGATKYYQKSLDAVADPELSQKATAVWLVCHPPTKTPAPTAVEPTQPVETTPPVVKTTPPVVETTPAPADTQGTPKAPASHNTATSTPTPKKK